MKQCCWFIYFEILFACEAKHLIKTLISGTWPHALFVYSHSDCPLHTELLISNGLCTDTQSPEYFIKLHSFISQFFHRQSGTLHSLKAL